MKKIIIILLAFSIMISFTACKETPKSPIVTENNNEDLLEKAEASNSENEKFTAIISELGIPETYKDNFTSENDSLVVNIDANVTIPEVDTVSIYNVEKMQITEDIGIPLLEKMLKGATIYTVPESIYELDSIKTKYQDVLAAQAKGEQLLETVSNEDLIKHYDDRIEYINSNLDPKPLELKYFDSQESRYDINCTATIDGFPCLFTIVNMGETEFTMRKDNAEYLPPLPNENSDSPSYSLEEKFVKEAEEYINNKDMVCVYDDIVYDWKKDKTAYRLIYMRNYGGVDSNYANHILTDPSYSQPWEDECYEIVIDDTGIVQFEWRNPCKEVKSKVEEANLLEFEEIKDIFEKIFTVKYANNDENIMNYKITSVALEMEKISSNSSTALVTPVWNFKGTAQTTSSENEIISDYTQEETLLTINAVSGAIILN